MIGYIQVDRYFSDSKWNFALSLTYTVKFSYKKWSVFAKTNATVPPETLRITTTSATSTTTTRSTSTTRMSQTEQPELSQTESQSNTTALPSLITEVQSFTEVAAPLSTTDRPISPTTNKTVSSKPSNPKLTKQSTEKITESKFRAIYCSLVSLILLLV